MRPADAMSAIDHSHVRRRFDRVAAGFDAADFVHTLTRDGLFARLEPMATTAKLVVDLGCGTGSARRQLEKSFAGALVIGCDLSLAMLLQASRKRRLFSRPGVVQADALGLPFADQDVDVVFSNMVLPWIGDIAAAFAEVRRVLRKDGLFVFSTLGPDSLQQLRHAVQQADPASPVQNFPDMHDIGDAAIASGLREPVLDVDRLTVTYPTATALFADLKKTGAGNSLRNRRRTLSGKSRFQAVQQALDAGRSADMIGIDLEIVYGHCWGAGASAPRGEYAVDAGRIGIRHRAGN